MSWLLFTLVALAFAATDVFLFYVFFEAMLIPVYFLIGGGGISSFSRISKSVYG